MKIARTGIANRFTSITYNITTIWSTYLSLHHWEVFYRQGSIATGPSQADGNYDLEILQTWNDFFENCPTNARILDIATGNGAVAIIASEVGRKLDKNFEIHACDLAQINPIRDVPNSGDRMSDIKFHPGMSVEKLTFPDNHFDAVSGQYALEYTDIAQSFNQLKRTMKPAGKAQFIIHHTDSVLVRKTMILLDEAAFILQHTKIFRRLKHLVSAQLATPKFAESAGQQLRTAIQDLKQALPDVQANGGGNIIRGTLDTVHQILKRRSENETDFIALDRDIANADAELRYWVRRQKDLLSSAKDSQGMQEIESMAKEAGFEIKNRDLQFHAESNIVGWKMAIRCI